MYTFFVHLVATEAWLRLVPAEREQYVAHELGPVLAQYAQVRLAFYDAEAFTAKCSDIAVFEAETLGDYTALMDDLRNSKLFTVPYFRVVDIFPAQRTQFV